MESLKVAAKTFCQAGSEPDTVSIVLNAVRMRAPGAILEMTKTRAERRQELVEMALERNPGSAKELALLYLKVTGASGPRESQAEMIQAILNSEYPNETE